MKQGFWQREWMEILRQYGTRVTVFDRRDGEGSTGWALLQPVLEKNARLP